MRRTGFLVLALGGLLAAQASAQAASRRDGYVDAGRGVRLHWFMTGVGRDTVVVVHGGPGLPAGYLAPDLEPLARRHALLFYDRRGEGASTLVSDSARLTLEAQVADLEAVRRHFGLVRMTLLAHSFGGLLAARYAHEHPGRVARLVLVSPGPLRAAPYRALIGRHITAWMDGATLAALARLDAARSDTTRNARATCRAYSRLIFRGYFADPADTTALHGMRGDFCAGTPASILNELATARYVWASFAGWDWRDDFRDVRVPVLVIAGTHDVAPAEAYREWAAAFPHAELLLLDGAGHFSYLERPARFFPAVEALLR